MTMLEPEDYLAEVLGGLEPLDPVETPLHGAHGLVLAEDVTACLPVPPWTNSAMDGYAVRARDAAGASADHPVALAVTGDVPAGCAPRPLRPGTAQRIMTGAMLPQGADAVVRVEDTDQPAGPGGVPAAVEIRACPAVGANVRRAGEDLGAGSPVAAAGSVLSARALAALASVGRASVRVRPRVRVAVVSTGAELRDPGEELAPGTIPDSNGLLLAGLVAEQGAQCTAVERSADSAEELGARLVGAAARADLIITSGGISAGAFDPLTELAHDGAGGPAGPHRAVDLVRAGVAMQPGKPQAHGWVLRQDGRRVPLLCLPGNPVSVLVSFTTIAVPVLARLGGYDAAPPRPGPLGAPHQALTALAAEPWSTPRGRRQYLPVRIVAEPTAPPAGAGAREHGDPASRLWVAPTHRLGSGSHLVASLPAAQALAVVGADVERVEVGDRLELLPLSRPPAPRVPGPPETMAP